MRTTRPSPTVARRWRSPNAWETSSRRNVAACWPTGSPPAAGSSASSWRRARPIAWRRISRIRRGGPWRWRGRASASCGRTDWQRAEEEHTEALALARECKSRAAEAVALVSRDELRVVTGHDIIEDASAEEALALAEAEGDPSVIVFCLAQLCQRLEWRGSFSRAIEIGERAIEIGIRENLTSETLFGGWFTGIAHAAVANYQRSLGILEQALQLCDRIGDRAVKARVLNTVGWVYAEFGCYREAMDLNRLATDHAREMVELGLVAGAPELYANAAINLAGNLSMAGQVEAAVDQLAPIEAHLAASDDPWMEWRYSLHVFDAAARLWIARGEAEEALALADKEVEGARSVACQKLFARALETRARALVAADRRDDAEPALHEALGVARAIGYRPVIWRSTSLLAEVARRSGDGGLQARWTDETRALVDDTVSLLASDAHRAGLRQLGDLLIAEPLSAHG